MNETLTTLILLLGITVMSIVVMTVSVYTISNLSNITAQNLNLSISIHKSTMSIEQQLAPNLTQTKR
ncbi:MAG: hypothetical protein QXS81_01310 [Candidatus Micrarchaeaceae archaeon]